MRNCLLGVAMLLLGASPALAICPLVLHPVCVVKPDGTRARMANSCVAERKHATILHDGDCAAPGKAPMMCNMLYQPVCATDPASGAEKSYPNLCHAEVAKAKLLHDGECAAAKKDK